MHAHLAALVADGRLRNAVTGEVAWAALPGALQRHGRPRRDRQAGARPVSPGPGRTELDLDADEIVTAAVAIFEESGLDAVSMRSVSARLGVSPVPLYSRVGNKDALVDAIADRLLADLAPPPEVGEPWGEYAARWARSLPRRCPAGAGQPPHPVARPGGVRRSVPTARGRAPPGRLRAGCRGPGVPPAHLGDRRVRRGRERGRTPRSPTAALPTRRRSRRGRPGRGRHAVRPPHPLRGAGHRTETRPDDDPHPRRHREGRGGHRRQQGPRTGDGPGLRRGRGRRGGGQPQARCVRGGGRRRCERSAAEPARWPATWATGTSARPSSSRPSPSTAASTCS